MFSASCDACQAKVVDDSVNGRKVEMGEESVPHTLDHESSRPQVEGDSNSHGQWTVVRKRKSKPKVIK
jgi:hypothetical protein